MTVPQPEDRADALVVVTGANGFVGARVCHALAQRRARVRALVRRAGAAPDLDLVSEVVGDFTDPDMAADVVAGATAVVTTVYPFGWSDPDQVRRVAVEGTMTFAHAARQAGVPVLVHLSTAAVYDRSPGRGDVGEDAALVGDDAGTYAVTKRDLDAQLARLDGMTRVLVRPPAILGSGPTSIWNTVRPASVRRHGGSPPVNPAGSFGWVHVDDLATLVADLATGGIAAAADPDEGPVPNGCTPVNAAAEPASQSDYYEAVCQALGMPTRWTDEPAWKGSILAERAHRWGWRPQVSLAAALDELRRGLQQGQ